VMAEAMACGTPVLALPGGSVEEVVAAGASGYVCKDVAEMVSRARNLDIPPRLVREYAEQNFSVARMVDDYVKLYERVVADQAAQEQAVA